MSCSPPHCTTSFDLGFVMATTTFMRSALLVLSMMAVMTLGQPPPTEGYQLGSSTFDIIMPLTVAQCEPVLIYYNIASDPGLYTELDFFTANNYRDYLAWFYFPTLTGYLEWICNIPAGYSFVASGYVNQLYTVQAGSSSACLGNITTTYSDVQYETIPFRFFTEASPTISYSTTFISTVAYPTGSFQTFTANPAATTSATSSPTLESRKSAIVGDVIVAVIIIVVLIILAGVIVLLQRRRKPRSTTTIEPSSAPITPSMAPIVPSTKPELTGDMGQFRPGYFATPVVSSSNTRQTSNTPTSAGGETVYRDSPVPPSIPSTGDPREYDDIATVLGAATRLSSRGRHIVSNILTSNSAAPPEAPRGANTYSPPLYPV